MEKAKISDALQKVRQKKCNFKQSIDIVINLKNIDQKKDGEKLDFFVQLHYPKGKPAKVCALVGPELYEQAKKECATAIVVDDFPKYQKDKRLVKQLARKHDFFIAQATIMPKVATVFGRVLGPKGKMPNPKAGCVVPPNANLKQVIPRLNNLVRLNAKKEKIFSCSVGMEEGKDEEIIDNIMTVYNQAVHHLPNEKQNIGSVYLKLTMSKPERID
ncbi:MAG: hypothetical protein KJ709_03135 [Nanoarchaeota archaeon]|nr:hypothetical protein [Nanoarchaeota archaeon]